VRKILLRPVSVSKFLEELVEDTVYEDIDEGVYFPLRDNIFSDIIDDLYMTVIRT
jgi:hypothetical protein